MIVKQSSIVKDTKLELATVTNLGEKVKRAFVASCCLLTVQLQRAQSPRGVRGQPATPADTRPLLDTAGLS